MVGTSLYTSNFTPSTQPLTALTNTQILTCQSNRFVDNSASNRVINIFAAGVSAQAFSPFVPAYITPTTYSNYFDGTGDYLVVGSPTATNIAANTNFTVEGWVYLVSKVTNSPAIFTNYVSGGANSLGLFAGHSSFSSTEFNLYCSPNLTSGGTIAYNTWTHFAIVRNGTGSNNVILYINGVPAITQTSNDALTVSGAGIFIGSSQDSTANSYINGCVSNFRWNNTTALYTAAFTPPTAPLTAVSGTQLLTCQSSTFIDNSTNAYAITGNGSVKVVASPTPFPAKVDTTTLNSAYSTSLIGGSAYFDGSGDYLTLASNTAFSWGSGDFSMETWFYPQTTGLLRLFDSDSAPGFLFFQNVNNTFGFYGGNSTFYESANNAITQFAWNHLVVTGVGGTLRLFVNGVLVLYSAAGGSSTASARTCGINGTGTQPATGYMANVRLVKGGIPTLYSTTSTSVGVGVFVPPIAAFTGSEALTGGAVSLLTNFTNGAIFDNTAKNVLETVGTVAISSTQAKYGTTSMYFDGTAGNRLQISSTVAPANFNMGTGNYSVEFWMFSGTPGSQQCLIDFRNADTSGQGISLNYRTDRTIALYMQGDRITTPALTASTWTHVAAVRSSGTYTVYINGVSAGTWANADVVAPPLNRPYIGAVNNGTQEYIGYIDDLRITKGYARYTTNFTPPTSQLQDQ
jgi:hypothetical protein